MTIQQIQDKLEELRRLYNTPECGRSRTSIELEGKVLRIVLDKKLKRRNLGSK